MMDTVEIEVHVVHATDAAVLVRDADFKDVWLPRSTLDDKGRAADAALDKRPPRKPITLDVAEWKAEEMGWI